MPTSLSSPPHAAADLAALALPYDDHRKAAGDKNLANPESIRVLADVIGEKQWDAMIETARKVVPERVAAGREHRSAVERAIADAQDYFARRIYQLEIRRRSNADPGTDAQLDAERTLAAAMRKAVGHPSVRVDAAGVVILSGRKVPKARDRGKLLDAFAVHR